MAAGSSSESENVGQQQAPVRRMFLLYLLAIILTVATASFVSRFIAPDDVRLARPGSINP
jgi:hypothetical protein